MSYRKTCVPGGHVIHIIGETVFLSQRKKKKFVMTFDLSSFQVTRIKGTMVTAIRNRVYVTSNISQFKKIFLDMIKPELLNDNEDINLPQGNPQLNVLPLNPPQSVCNRCYPVQGFLNEKDDFQN